MNGNAHHEFAADSPDESPSRGNSQRLTTPGTRRYRRQAGAGLGAAPPDLTIRVR